MTRRSAHTTVLLTTFLTAAALAATVDRPRPDGDGRTGEAWAIVQRARAYALRHSEDGTLRPAELLARARLGYRLWRERMTRLHAQGIQDGAWVNMGPVNGAGRCVAIAPHPTQEGTVLVGAAGGGVWRTTDGGQTWTPLTDGVPDLAVGAIAYAPSDPNVVYVGTGEGGWGIDFIAGIGLLRSEDGGETWILPDEVVARQFFRISVDPEDPDTVLAATNEGLLRSTDGGATWTAPIPARWSGGDSRELAVTDVVRSPTDPDLVYAALWCYGPCPAGTGRVMRSTDRGLTWEQASTGLPVADPDASLNRIALALSPSSDRDLVVALNVSEAGDGDPPVRVYRSRNGGESWTRLTNPPRYLGAQGWYDNTLTVAPGSGGNRIIAGGVSYVLSTDGGQSWSEQNPYESPGLPHVDAHDLQWQGTTLWLVNDGGVWKSTDRGETWTDCNAGLVTRQFYSLAVDPVHRERVLAGAQDNGTNRRSDADDDTWEEVLGADGFDCGINWLFPDVVYATIYETRVYRATDGAATPYSFRNISPHFPDGEHTPFITPLTLRPDTPWVVYTGTSRVWESRDGGDTWHPLPTEVSNGEWSDQEVWAVAVTPADPDRIVVSKDRDLYLSGDHGRTWWLAPVGDGGLPGNRMPAVQVSPVDPDTILAGLATLSGPPLYRSDDGGVTWSPSADGLPRFPVQVIRWDPTDPEVVFAGTDVGLYRSTDGGHSWAPFGDGLPAGSIHDIEILPDGSMLRVASHGRGVWELDLGLPVNHAPEVEITSPTGSVVRATVGDTVTFTGRIADPDGDPVRATWVITDRWEAVDAGSGAGTLEPTLERTFELGGTYKLALRGDDDRGGAGLASLTVRIEDPADDCSSARTIPGSGPFPVVLQGNNTSARSADDDPTPPCIADPDDAKAGTYGSMWFAFTPQESHRYVISTCGSGADTVLSAWTGSCGLLHAVAGGCNDDDEMVHCDGARTDSYLELDLEAGTTYRFMVSSYATSSKGRFTLTVECADCPVTEPDRYYIVPAAAHAAGKLGTVWRTDLVLYNPGDAEVRAELAFLPAGGDNTGAGTVPVTVPAGASVVLEDVVSSVLGRSGSGAIRIGATGELRISSRTFTATAGGSYGQYIPAVLETAAMGPGTTAVLPGLRETDAFRTNLGLVNASGVALDVDVDLAGPDGSALGHLDVALAPYEWKQIGDVLEKVGAAGVAAATARIRHGTADGALLAYASVVDNRTGDPVYITPGAEVGAGEALWVPAAAHATGFGGSQWRTELVLANLGPESSQLELAFLPTGSDNTSPVTTTLALAPGEVRVVDDAVEALFGASGTGALRIVPDAGPVTVLSRTYNLTPEGTYGQFIAAVPETAGFAAGESALLSGLSGDADFYTNIGVVNLATEPIAVRIDLRDAGGGSLGVRTVNLPPWSHVQVNKAIPGSAGVRGARAVITSDTPGARFLAYGSVVDASSGDPVLVPAEPGS